MEPLVDQCVRDLRAERRVALELGADTVIEGPREVAAEVLPQL
jgi:hypothetical protein